MARKTTILLALIVLFVAMPCKAADIKAPRSANIQVGALQVHPSVSITETYSDNIYQSYDAKEKESDYITTISPEINFLLPIQRHSVELGYKADVYNYADLSENNYVNQTASGALNLNFPVGLMFRISDTFKDLTTPREWKEQAGVAGSEDLYREKDHQTNDFNVMTKYRFVDRWAVEVRYNNYQDKYKEVYDNGSDFSRDMVGGAIYYSLTPKTDILVDYSYSDVNYDHADTNDNENHMAYVGLSFDPTAKIQGYAKFGWAEKKYKQSSTTRDDSASIFSTLVNLGYIVTPLDKITVSATRVIDEDVDNNAAYTSTNASLAWSHLLAWNEKISMTASLGYGNRDYDMADTDVDGTSKIREDDSWNAGIGFGYMMQRWLKFALNYSYTHNGSNFERYDYDENRVFFSVTLQY
ncbi:MAG: outer membrane beta-barrel protein [Deltaproteobacteria bacterium]|nr:outer membrane beta-barrel protein [Deltaproteobacteria bacterium]